MAINVALYGDGGKRWTMTERSRASLRRDTRELVVGPSGLRWDGQALTISIDEVGMPIPRRVLGTVRVHPAGLCGFQTTLDARGAHRWGPIAPCARVEVDLHTPALRWSGHGYLDSNEGDEPIARPFAEWDWSRAALPGGDTGVIYDVREKDGSERVIAQRFRPDGRSEAFDAPPRQKLPRSAWWVARHMRSDAGTPPRVQQTLEDTPFYVRSLVESGLFGGAVTSLHETLNVPRLDSVSTRLMLPWRMPRVR